MSQEPMLPSNSYHQEKAADGSLDSSTTNSDIPRVRGSADGSIPMQFISDHTADTDFNQDASNTPTEPQATPATLGAAAGGKGRPKGSVQIREPPVSEKHGYKIVKIEQKHGILHRAIPVMPLWLAILLCLLNILLPGTGTVISAFTVLCCGITTRMSRPVHAMALNLISGLLQMATFLLIVGWIWSILWGMTFVQLALSAKEDVAALPGGGLPYYVRRHSSVE